MYLNTYFDILYPYVRVDNNICHVDGIKYSIYVFYCDILSIFTPSLHDKGIIFTALRSVHALSKL